MKNKKHTPETDLGKSISAQLSDIRSENRALRREIAALAGKISNQNLEIGNLTKRIGM